MQSQRDNLTAVELQRLALEFGRLKNGKLDPELFKKIRLQYGIYSMRGETDCYMIRISFPLGRVTPPQLKGLAFLVEKWASDQGAHLTTRQDVQIYGIQADHVVEVLRRLDRLGLTTRETSGNVVRNIVCCPHAGVSPGEAFDVTPYARQVRQYFFRNPLTQNMPRKIKIAFEGCLHDHVKVGIHDIGVRAVLRDGREGFQIYVGGGLGAAPRAGQLLEPWTEAGQLLLTLEAIIRIFDRTGDRARRDKARLKFLVQQRGWEVLRQEIIQERQTLWLTQSGRTLQPEGEPVRVPRQQGRVNVLVRVPLGDLGPKQLRGLARVAQRHVQEMRLTPGQNLLLRGVSSRAVPALHGALGRLQLAEGGGGCLVDVTRCRGSECCLSAITRPRGLVEALEKLFHNGLSRWALLPFCLKVSGCANACGHHPVADMGLYGVASKVNEKFMPFYQILVGGKVEWGEIAFGERLLKIPARSTPEAIRRLVDFYGQHKSAGEDFSGFVTRVGKKPLEDILADLADVSKIADQPGYFCDLGTSEPYSLQAGKGECAA